ncbi:MAG: hypothetical protein KAK01_02130 [Candidatus Marinimicrobia bacterium]|nr:hypothetical protein [Candidatus Neomarinimicrobiota bacterium]
MKTRNLIVVLGILISNSSWLTADNRSYVWTYEYQTMQRGEAEIEHYTTITSPFADSLKGTVTTEHNIEVEVGMNDRFDFSVYQNFKQIPDGSLEYTGYKLRARYRLGEKGLYPVDPLLYFEYKGKPDFSEHSLEGKLILARDFGNLNIAINPVFEMEYEDDNWKSEVKYNAGARFIVNSLFKAGIEMRSSETGTYFGPTVSHGSERFWFAIGTLYAISEVDNGKPEFMLRLILGIGL